MELIDAIVLVVQDTRAENPGSEGLSDIVVIDQLRDEVDDDEITLWVETEVIEPGDLEDAYRLVIAVDDDAIEDAFGN